MPLLSEIAYGSLLQYAVRGTTDQSRKSKTICHAIKLRAYVPHIEKSVAVIRRCIREGHEIGGFFGPDLLLVPAPGHAPFAKNSAKTLWVPNIICSYLVAGGLASRSEPCLIRHTAVAKSATAGRHAPRNARVHYDSIGVAGMQFEQPTRITVVDDVVTTGATLLACASRVQEIFPDAEVRCFGLISPVSDGDVTSIIAPSTGRIDICPDYTTFRT